MPEITHCPSSIAKQSSTSKTKTTIAKPT